MTRLPTIHARTHQVGGTDPLTFPGVPSLSDSILALTGLDAFWKLNEAAGATAALDSSGNGYTLGHVGFTVPDFGNTGVGIGPPGEQSAFFDGGISSGKALSRDTTPAFQTNNFTAFGWLRRAGSAGLDDDMIFGRCDVPSVSTGWRLWADNADSYKMRLSVGGFADIVSDNVLAAATWYMWAVRRAAGTWSLFVNAVEQAAHSTSAPSVPSGAPIHIGARTITNNYYQGYQSYVALLHTALTNAEILNLYVTAGLAGTTGAGMVWTNPGAGGDPYWAYPVGTWINGV